MTDEQRKLVISILQSGFACGMTHPFECFVNYTRFLGQITPIATLEQDTQAAEAAFLEFWKGTACCPEEQAEFDALTVAGLYAKIDAWYKAASEQHQRDKKGST